MTVTFMVTFWYVIVDFFFFSFRFLYLKLTLHYEYQDPLTSNLHIYRDKILSGSRFYSKLARTIIKQYPELGPGEPRERPKSWGVFGKTVPRAIVPSFPQFVQFLLDEAARGQKLDEHWTPMSQFCTPCLVDFDVFAKVHNMLDAVNRH